MTKMSALGDLTGDGHVDLITVDSSGVSRIYAGAGACAGVGRFGAPLVFGPGWDNFVSMSVLGDETNDTRTDILVVDKLGVAWIGKSGLVAAKVTWVMVSPGWDTVSVYSG